MEVLTFLTILAVLIAIIIHLYFKWAFTYWKRRGVPCPEPTYLFGNVKDLITRRLSMGDVMERLYSSAKSKNFCHTGAYFFQAPVYVPVDLDIIKNILQKDFDHFVNHGMYVNEEHDPISLQLFNLEDEQWRKLRTKLTPTFTSGKLKMMFETLISCTNGLEDILSENAVNQDPVDIKDVVSRFTTDIIGSCAFGIDCNSLKNPDSEFRIYGNKFFEPGPARRLYQTLFFMLPRSVLKFFNMKQNPQDLIDFFTNMVKHTIEYREQNNIYRKDFMHLLLQLKNKGEVTDDQSINRVAGSNSTQTLSLNEIVGQCFVFFVAGFETSATTMTFALLELSQHLEIQEKVRKEILTVLDRHGGQLTYEAVQEMEYLNKVVNETLRKHPPIAVTPRLCNKRYKVPGTSLTLEPGDSVAICIQGIHRDPEYYPEPDKFDPERFSEENKAKRPQFAFLAFGEGPRICIGARFAMMQVKVGLIDIIKNFKVTLNKKTQTPVVYETKTFITAVKGGVWLNVSKIT